MARDPFAAKEEDGFGSRTRARVSARPVANSAQQVAVWLRTLLLVFWAGVISLAVLGCRGVGARRLLDQMAEVIGPVAVRFSGAEPESAEVALHRAWREAFGRPMPASVASRCAAAISEGRPWQPVLWHE